MGNEETPFFGDWQKKRKLGSGGFGEVTLWQNRTNNKCVAVKKCIIPNGLSKERNTKTQVRWLNEIECMDKKIKCEYIVQTAQVDGDFEQFLNKSNPSGLPVLIMDYHDGGDLRRLLNKTEHSNGLPEKEVKNVLKSLVGAIQYLHSINIAHRDIKPENIVIQRHDSGSIYKLTDLGYARELYSTGEASQVGTIGYFAPEVILDMEYSRTVDYWSFGVIAFEVICGCRPYIPHQTIPQWIKQLKSKGSQTIAITEDNLGEFYKHQDLFVENQISNCFKNILVPWFVLALEFNPKQRGCIFENKAPDEVTTSPTKVLKIFIELEAALQKKILTVFAISSYKFLSYEITELTTLKELIARISVDTKIPHGEMFLTLPIDRSFQITNNTRPIDLYQNDNNDTPMVYVTHLKHALAVGNPELSNHLQYVLLNPGETLKPWYLLECARHALYLYRSEQKHYVTLLRGIKYYALTLEHEISLFGKHISEMENRNIQLRSAFKLCMGTITYSKRKLEQKRMITAEKSAAWTSMLMKLEKNMEKLSGMCLTVTTRYNSALRRSKETVETSSSPNNDHFILSLPNNDQDYLKVSAMERLYETIREEKLRNTINPKASMDILCQAVCECLETRSKLLKSGELKNTQITIGEIHQEYLKIREVFADIVKNIENQLNQIKILSERHIDEFAMIVEEATMEKCKMMSEDIPMIDGAMGTLNINDNAPNAVYVYSSSNPCSMDVSLPSFEDGPDARDVIGENRAILQSLQEFAMELEDLSHP